ncbi:MAG: ROK family protein [Dehalococcoidales bacterium]
MNKQAGSNSRNPTYIGLDIGKTKIATGLVTSSGEILLKNQVLTDLEKGGEAILGQCRELVKQILNSSSVKPGGIGIGSTGVVEPEKGIIVSSGSISGWCNIKIREKFEEEFKIPVAVDNDVHVAALGEHLFGAGRGANTSVFMVISTGVGFSIVKDGRIWRGSHNLAGQIAHLPLFDRKKTVNDVFSGKGIAERASELLGQSVSTDNVFKLASEGNVEAKHVIEEAIEGAALMVALIQNTIDPDVFIVGGGVALGEKDFLENVYLKIEEFLVKYRVQLPEGLNITLSQLGTDAGLVGCVGLFAKR